MVSRTRQENPRGPVTIADVAREAGVSTATASRAINDSPKVTAKTKQRVADAVARTGFVRNALGHQLAVGRAEALALLITEPFDELFLDPTYASIMRGVAERLASTPTLPVLVQAWSQLEHDRALRHLQRRAFDAVILISPYVGGDMLKILASEALPVVQCGQLPGAPYEGIFSTVYADDVEGAMLAGRLMVERGRRRIGVINGPASNPAATDRMAGYRESLGALFRDDLATHTGWDSAAGLEAMRHLLALDPGIDGILCGSDRIAVGALAALQAAGRSVPEDVSVIGFDDQTFAATTTPPLTTVHQPLLEEGRIAAEMALAMVDGQPARTTVLQTHVVLRSSL